MQLKRNTKHLRIIRILLENPNGEFTKYKISKLVDSSTTRVIQVLKKLEELKLVSNTKVINLDKLIDYYIKVNNIKLKKYYFHLSNPIDFFKNISEDYAFTTYVAENMINHHLFMNKFQVYIKQEDFSKLKENITSKGLIGKGNLTLIILNDPEVITGSKLIGGVKVVSIPQLLIDLKKEGGVCIEAYNILLDKYVRQKRN
ncbi:MAG: hypothetical protein WCX82_04365 [archaeon]|jgi:hypothetical protein